MSSLIVASVVTLSYEATKQNQEHVIVPLALSYLFSAQLSPQVHIPAACRASMCLCCVRGVIVLSMTSWTRNLLR